MVKPWIILIFACNSQILRTIIINKCSCFCPLFFFLIVLNRWTKIHILFQDHPETQVSWASLSTPACWFAAVVAVSVRPYGTQHASFLCPWDSPGKDTRAGCHFLFQGIFLTQGSHLHLLCLLHCSQNRYPLDRWVTRNKKKKVTRQKITIKKLNCIHIYKSPIKIWDSKKW